MDKPNYGIDALPVIRNLALISLAAFILFFVIDYLGILGGLRYSFISIAITFMITPLLMLAYARFGKFRHRDRMLKMISWAGDEMVLDVGTGRGLLMIGAAKRLNSGRAIGIDIWNASDLSGNKIENTLRNAELEDVAEKVEVRNEDARKTDFKDSTFDVVLSNLCLHNISDEKGRRSACQEIARILKPGGSALISDFKSTGLYEKAFRDAGLNVERSGPYLFDTFPPLRILRAEKKASEQSAEI